MGVDSGDEKRIPVRRDRIEEKQATRCCKHIIIKNKN